MSKLIRTKLPSTWILVLRAYLLLIRFDIDLFTTDLQGLLKHVGKYPRPKEANECCSIERIVSAMDLASVLYWKHVLCLQRASATTCLMRTFGLRAELVIGAQMLPFKSHAWVEVDGKVVGERLQLPPQLSVLDRC